MPHVRTRFAPSPTGDLHVGGAWTALASWLLARRAGGDFVIRVEDLDGPRVVPGAAERQLEDLAWLGITWDEAPWRQSTRSAAYEAALTRLAEAGLTYPCDCSRAEIARVASAPHAGEETVYPGLCRERDPRRPFKRPPAIRLRVPDAVITVRDGVAGEITQNLARDVGDFVLKRGDGVYAYQLAVVVDDVAQAITDVVRGADLLASTPRQVYLMNALGVETIPRYWHVPLVVASDGTRLAKRTPGGTLRSLRAAGMSAEELVGTMAHALGFLPTNAPVSASRAAELSRGLALDQVAWPTSSWRIPERWATRAKD